MQKQEEQNEISQLYAIEDMKEEQWNKTYNSAQSYYQDLEKEGLDKSSQIIQKKIKNNIINRDNIVNFLENLIIVFQDTEEYEKCHFISQLKSKI